MKKIIFKLFSNKKILALLSISLLIILIFGTYATFSILKNLQKMDAVAETTYYPTYPELPKNHDNIAQIQRGEYLVKAGDCIACHTDTTNKGDAFAGGLAMATPFGTIYTPNITSDKTTGIGNWTEDEFIKAMREGVSPQGHYYYPAFPFYYFNKVSTEDLKAIKAYLDAVPAIKKDNKENDMMWPFNYRFLQLGWRVMFFKPENNSEYKANPHLDPSINRGAYLVQGLGHCAMCHSPSYHLVSEKLPLGAPIEKYDLTGAKIQGFMAPNITHANLSKIPVKEIVEVFTKNRMIGGGNVEGPMLEANHNSLVHLSQNDLENIAIYLKNVKSQMPPKPKGGPGKATYESYCAGCHATGSGGSPKFGDAVKWDPILKTGLTKVYYNAIHGKNSMPAKGNCLSCSDQEITQAVDFMIAAVGGNVGSKKNNNVHNKLTTADGKLIYEKNCSVCHDTGFNNAPKPHDKLAWQKITELGFPNIFKNVTQGLHGHPPRGACATCTDADLKAASKYLLDQGDTNKNFELW